MISSVQNLSCTYLLDADLFQILIFIIRYEIILPTRYSAGPLEFMDDIPIRTERGVREVTTEEWGKLKGYPSSWVTTAKDRPWVIQEPSLYVWSVLGDAFAPTLIHQENPKLEHNEEDDAIYTSIPPLSPRPPWEEDSSDEESEDEVDHHFPVQLELPPNMDAPF
jgi:hypothetical protein